MLASVRQKSRHAPSTARPSAAAASSRGLAPARRSPSAPSRSSRRPAAGRGGPKTFARKLAHHPDGRLLPVPDRRVHSAYAAPPTACPQAPDRGRRHQGVRPRLPAHPQRRRGVLGHRADEDVASTDYDLSRPVRRRLPGPPLRLGDRRGRGARRRRRTPSTTWAAPFVVDGVRLREGLRDPAALPLDLPGRERPRLERRVPRLREEDDGGRLERGRRRRRRSSRSSTSAREQPHELARSTGTPKNAETDHPRATSRAPGSTPARAGGTAPGRTARSTTGSPSRTSSRAAGSTDPRTSRLFAERLPDPLGAALGRAGLLRELELQSMLQLLAALLAATVHAGITDQTLEDHRRLRGAGKDLFAECAGLGSFEGGSPGVRRHRRRYPSTQDGESDDTHSRRPPASLQQAARRDASRPGSRCPLHRASVAAELRRRSCSSATSRSCPRNGAIQNYRPQTGRLQAGANGSWRTPAPEPASGRPRPVRPLGLLHALPGSPAATARSSTSAATSTPAAARRRSRSAARASS